MIEPPKNPWFVVAKPGDDTRYAKRTHVSRYLGGYKPFQRERLPEAAVYYQHQFPGLRVPLCGWVSVCCCFHEEKRPSLRIHLGSGAFRCFGCGAKGRDILAFQQRRYGMTFVEAVRFFQAGGVR